MNITNWISSLISALYSTLCGKFPGVGGQDVPLCRMSPQTSCPRAQCPPGHSDLVQCRLSPIVQTVPPHSCFVLVTPSPSDMPAWYPLQLDPWQINFKYLNSATKLLNDSVAQLARAWQNICQVAGSSPYRNHNLSFFPSFFHVFISHFLSQ